MTEAADVFGGRGGVGVTDVAGDVGEVESAVGVERGDHRLTSGNFVPGPSPPG